MEQWQKNLQTVSRGGGSSQGRTDHCDCVICNPLEEVEEGEEDED